MITFLIFLGLFVTIFLVHKIVFSLLVALVKDKVPAAGLLFLALYLALAYYLVPFVR